MTVVYYKRTAHQSIELFDKPHGKLVAIILPGAVVSLDIGSSVDGHHNVMLTGVINDLDRMEDRTE